jgi:hypothetical protein
MRAAFSLLALVIVAAIVLSLVKKQSAALKPAATAASQAEPAGTPQPQAVGRQVQGSIDEAARRAAEAASAATN